jgi:hypothetical protein
MGGVIAVSTAAGTATRGLVAVDQAVVLLALHQPLPGIDRDGEEAQTDVSYVAEQVLPATVP